MALFLFQRLFVIVRDAVSGVSVYTLALINCIVNTIRVRVNCIYNILYEKYNSFAKLQSVFVRRL